MKTLKVAFRGVADGSKKYEVITAKNTTTYDPGEILRQGELSELCNNPSWDVVILGPQPKREG